MGSVIRTFKKTARALTKNAGNIIEATIEKPTKKIGKELFDTVAGTTDEERRAMLGEMPDLEITPEVTPEIIPDDVTVLGRGRKRIKRAGQAGTIMEEYGTLSAKPIKKAVEKA